MKKDKDIYGYSIFCDDIRQEITGKQIFIGVYTGDMMVPSFPATAPISVWTRIFGLKKGKYTFEARISHSDEIRGVKGEGTIDNEDRPLTISLPGAILTLKSEGEIKFEISFNNGEFEVIGTLPVLLDDNTSIPSSS